MHLVRTKLPAFVAAFAALFLTATTLLAEGEFIKTGAGTRVKKIAFISVDVYDIAHYMKKLPASKSKPAVVDMDIGKKFELTLKRDVDHERIVEALKGAYAKNGYTDAAKAEKLLSALRGELKAGSKVTIVYDADKKTTTLTSDKGGSATVPGVDFMKATWNIWFGKIDQPDLGDKLISAIP